MEYYWHLSHLFLSLFEYLNCYSKNYRQWATAKCLVKKKKTNIWSFFVVFCLCSVTQRVTRHCFNFLINFIVWVKSTTLSSGNFVFIVTILKHKRLGNEQIIVKRFITLFFLAICSKYWCSHFLLEDNLTIWVTENEHSQKQEANETQDQ